MKIKLLRIHSPLVAAGIVALFGMQVRVLKMFVFMVCIAIALVRKYSCYKISFMSVFT